MDSSNANSHRMQASRRNDEAHAVEQGALPGWQLSSVRVSVEYGEEADQRRGNTEGRTHFEHYGSPKENCREGYSIFDARQRHSHESQHAADGHHHRECNREDPNRRRTKLRAPQADGNHSQHMIEPRDRMAKARKEPNGFTLLRVGKGGLRGEKHQN